MLLFHLNAIECNCRMTSEALTWKFVKSNRRVRCQYQIKTESNKAHLANKLCARLPVTAEPILNGEANAGDSNSVASTPPSQATAHVATPHYVSPWIDDEPVVKSPPEPTRVKSPEQMIMRSPEPVNWTVPLDTGKTFTVTQNVREGEFALSHLLDTNTLRMCNPLAKSLIRLAILTLW